MTACRVHQGLSMQGRVNARPAVRTWIWKLRYTNWPKKGMRDCASV